jgi:hypothetical protein
VNYNPLLTSNAVGSLAYTGSGTLKSTGVNTYSGTTTVGAGGLYLVNGSHSVATVGSYTVNGTLGGTGVITPSGVNSVTIGAFTGSLAPGDSTLATASQTGALNIGNSLSFGTGSAFNVQLGGASPGNGQGFYDQVNMTNVAGSITLNTGVLLNLSLVNSFTPAPDNIFYILNREDFGDFFTLFDGTSEGGTVLIGGCTAQITYQANWTGNQGTSSLTGGNDVAIYNFVIPEPRSVFLVSAGFGFMLCFRRRLKY